MFEYINTGGEFNINTPFCKDLSQVKTETISQTPECIHFKSEYPNGFIIEYLEYADKIIFKTNKPLVKNANGSYDVQL